MSYGSPTLVPSWTYKIEVGLADPPPDPPYAVVTVQSNGAALEVDMDACMQMLVDLLDGSPDFIVFTATKVTPSSQIVSPT